MESFFKKTNEIKTKLTFDPTRQAALREQLLAHTVAHPIRELSWLGRLRERLVSPTIITPLKPMRLAGLLSLIIILTGGSVSLAAEQALPGDLLYPIKIHVNEEARAEFTFSPRAAARWQVRRVERRLDEADTLSQKGQLTADVRATLKADFDSDSTSAEEKIIQLHAQGDVAGATELANQLEVVLQATLKAHEDIFTDPSDSTNDPAASPSGRAPVTATILARLKRVNKLRLNLDSSIEEQVSHDPAQNSKNNAELALTVATNTMDAVQSYINELRTNTDTEAALTADIKLSLAKDLAAEGKAKLAARAYDDAFRLALQAKKVATEAKALVMIEVETVHKDTDGTPVTSNSMSATTSITTSGTLPHSSVNSGVQIKLGL